MANSKRGFASMDPEKHRQLCSAAGKKSHRIGKGHEWTQDEARAAGKLGGQASKTKTKNGNGGKFEVLTDTPTPTE